MSGTCLDVRAMQCSYPYNVSVAATLSGMWRRFFSVGLQMPVDIPEHSIPAAGRTDLRLTVGCRKTFFAKPLFEEDVLDRRRLLRRRGAGATCQANYCCSGALWRTRMTSAAEMLSWDGQYPNWDSIFPIGTWLGEADGGPMLALGRGAGAVMSGWPVK